MRLRSQSMFLVSNGTIIKDTQDIVKPMIFSEQSTFRLQKLLFTNLSSSTYLIDLQSDSVFTS